VSWVTLFLLTLSAAAKQRRAGMMGVGGGVGVGVGGVGRVHHGISGASWVMLTAHWLYANACQKGEESAGLYRLNAVGP
jgi:hypothetical protein